MTREAADANPIRANRRVLAAAMVGTTVEYYDFFIYGTAAALVFGPLFFPRQDPAAQMLLSLLTFGIAFVARPVGAIAFGHFGDRVGRKSTLVAALMLMGLSTMMIALLPTYAMAEGWGAGWIAPLLLCLMRLGQGLGLGGEWGGASLLAVENAPPGWAGRFGAAPQLGAPIGLILANGLFLALGTALPQATFMAWGWRLPFLLSAALVVIGLWVRLRITETAEFQATLAINHTPHVPLATLLDERPGALVAGSAGVIATFAAFYMTTAFALALATTQFGYARNNFLLIQLIAPVFYAIGIVIGARRADQTSGAATITAGALVLAVIGPGFGFGLAAGNLALAALTLCLTMLVLGYNNAAQGPWLSSLFPVRLRYTGMSLAFNLGGIIGGALLPLVATQISTMGHPEWTGALMTLGGVLTFWGVSSASRAARFEALQDRLVRHDDRRAILDVIMRESRGRDRQDVDLIASCWWEDGIDEHGPIVMKAPDYPERANAGHARFFSATMHHLTTHTCEIDGDTAHCETYVIGTMLSPDKQSMKLAPGRYFDRLEKRGSEWRLLYRRVTVEMSMDGSAEWVNGPMCKGFLRSVWSKDDISYQRPIKIGTDGERW